MNTIGITMQPNATLLIGDNSFIFICYLQDVYFLTLMRIIVINIYSHYTYDKKLIKSQYKSQSNSAN